MGILNVTADSFSDGGRHLATDQAIEHGLRLAAEGADLVDVGGESTRPGAIRVEAETEISRVRPVVEVLASEGIAVSVDTMRASVAEAALEAGARVVNDVSGGLADPDMARVVGEAGCPWILMHWVSSDEFARGAGGRARRSDDLVAEVRDHLARRADAALAAGVDPADVVLDPGLGFAKNADDNWELLRGLDRLLVLGFPVLVAASRKRFLGTLLGDRPVGDRDDATAAITALAAGAGAWGVRVHDVPASADAVRVAAAWRAGRESDGAPDERER